MNDDDLETHHRHNYDHGQTRHPLVENDEEDGKSRKKRGNRRGSNSSSSRSKNNGDRKNDEKKGDSDCHPGKEGPPDSSAVQPNHPISDSDDRSLSCHSHLEPPSQQRDSHLSPKNRRPESAWETRQKQRRRRDRRRRLDKQRRLHPQRLCIETANFQSRFHGALCRAARYKAHVPYCSCFKAVSFRERYLQQQLEIEEERDQDEQTMQQPYRDHNEGTIIRIDSKEEEENGNEPNVLTREFRKLQLTDSNISGKDDIADNCGDAEQDNNNNDNSDDDPFDNLLVIPDTRSPLAIYSCRNTNSHRFRTEGTACETKLAREIFFENSGDNDDDDKEEVHDDNDGNNNHNKRNNNHYYNHNSNPIPPFKLTCAQCLLRTHQPNAFLALCSDSFLDLHAIVQHAHRAAGIPSSPEKTRHADHAHFVASVAVRYLMSLLPPSGTKKKKGSRPLIKKVLRSLHRGGGADIPDVFLPKKKEQGNGDGDGDDDDDDDGSGDHDEDKGGNDADERPRPVIELGHHLTSLLYALVNLREESQSPPEQLPPKIEKKMIFIMVIGYRDGWNKWTLDLPGGKRHLGETTLQSLLREVEEECSLEMRVDWWMERMPRLYGGNHHGELDGNENGMDDGVDFVVFGNGGLDEIENGNGTGERDDGGDFVVFGKNRRKHNGLVHVLKAERKSYDNTDVFAVAVPPLRPLQDEFLILES